MQLPFMLNAPVELVLPGHPDKICDQVSDTILDYFLMEDPGSRVAVECMIKDETLTVSGEITTQADLDYEVLEYHIWKTVFDPLGMGLPDIVWQLSAQSPQIGGVVDSGLAGDQAVVLGYASTDYQTWMPKNYSLASRVRDVVLQEINNHLAYLYFDGKVLVVSPRSGPSTVLVSVQHDREIDGQEVRELISDAVVAKIGEATVYVNPGADFIFGGSYADAGVTGRKIVVDSYGPGIPVGGGAFSGKDLTKVDRGGAYAARHVALAAALHFNQEARTHSHVFCQVSYGFGMKDPLSIQLSLVKEGPGSPANERYALLKWQQDNEQWIRDVLRPGGFPERFMRNHLNGWSFLDTAKRGHFGRRSVPWEYPDTEDL